MFTFPHHILMVKKRRHIISMSVHSHIRIDIGIAERGVNAAFIAPQTIDHIAVLRRVCRISRVDIPVALVDDQRAVIIFQLTGKHFPVSIRLLQLF